MQRRRDLTFMKNQTSKAGRTSWWPRGAQLQPFRAENHHHPRQSPVVGRREGHGRDSVTAFTIGNMSGVKTLVEIGTDFTLIEELEKTEAQIAELVGNRGKLHSTLQKYERARDAKINWPQGGIFSLQS